VSSPPNSPAVTQWFQRLEAAWARMPADERTRQREEVQQHLEALVKANEELGSSPAEAWQYALDQFGNPSKFGRRMVWEWRRKQGLVGPQLAAILCGIGVTAVASPAVMLINWLASTVTYLVMNIILIHEFVDGETWVLVWTPIIVGLVVGRKHPHRALAGASYAALTWPILPALIMLLVCILQSHVGPVTAWQWSEGYGALVRWLLLTCGAAYLASVTKRGWYRPSLADFKITLPSRTRQIRR